MKLEQFFADHYKPAKLVGKSPNTLRLYAVCFRNFAITLGRVPLVSDLTNESVLAHMERLIRDGRSKATANKERCELVALWRYAAKLKLLDTWPEVPKQKEPIRVPRAWTAEDMAKLLDACRKQQGNIGTVPAWLFWTSLVSTCLDTAERIGAVLACEWDWLEGDELLIKAEVRKGGKRDKWFKLSSETAQLLAQVRRHSKSDKIFHWPMCYTYLWTRYTKLLEQAGLPTGRRCGWHRIRRTTASVVYQSGMDPQDLLDHQDRRTTQRYLDPRMSRETAPSTILRQWLKGELPTQQQQDRKQA